MVAVSAIALRHAHDAVFARAGHLVLQLFHAFADDARQFVDLRCIDA